MINRNIDKEVEDFVNSIKDLWEDEALDGDDTESISRKILAELDAQNGNGMLELDKDEEVVMV